MPVALTVDDVVDYLGGSGTASPRTFYGLDVADVTITSRAITPSTAWVNELISEDTITAKSDLATTIALARAAQHLLGHLRTQLIAGGKPNRYSIGDMQVDKQDLLVLLRDAIREEQETEGRLLPLLISAGDRVDQTDQVVEHPIEGSDGISRVRLDAPPFGGFQ